MAVEIRRLIVETLDNLLHDCDEYKQRIAELEAAPAAKWISTEERLPVTGALCLIVWADTVQSVAWRRVGLGYACVDGYVWDAAHGEGDSIPDTEVTYWQYLPALPDEKENVNGR